MLCVWGLGGWNRWTTCSDPDRRGRCYIPRDRLAVLHPPCALRPLSILFRSTVSFASKPWGGVYSRRPGGGRARDAAVPRRGCEYFAFPTLPTLSSSWFYSGQPPGQLQLYSRAIHPEVWRCVCYSLYLYLDVALLLLFARMLSFFF